MKKTYLAIFTFLFTYQAVAHPVGELFLVDHYQANSGRGSFTLYKNWIKQKNLGGIVFWNGNNKTAHTFQMLTNDYKKAASDAGLNPPILSIDHEGLGVQRLAARQGLTNLAAPHLLGKSMNNYGVELCSLHGKIIAKELLASGFNAALSTVSDVYTPQSKSRYMLKDRAISNDPRRVAECGKAILDSVNRVNQGFIFTTKHFPGLGLVNGNTDTGVRNSTAKSYQEEYNNIYPFEQIIDFANSTEPENLGLMISNAYYPVLDPTNRPAPESYAIATKLLRSKLNFSGVLVSDALWVGQYEKLNSKQLKIALAKMVLAGLDMLMIPASKFETNYQFFLDLYNDRLKDQSIKNILTQDFGFKSTSDMIDFFRRRVNESSQRINRVKRNLDDAFVSEGVTPSSEVKAEAARYRQILKSL